MPGSPFLRRSEVHENAPVSTVSELNLILLGPPSVGQAEALEEAIGRLDRRLTAILYIEAPDEEIIRRLSGRRMCVKAGHVYNVYTDPPKRDEACDQDGSRLVQRDDDREATVSKRLGVYH